MVKFFLVLSLFFTIPLQAQTFSDGPYLRWTATNQVTLEAVCDSKIVRSAVSFQNELIIQNPCTGKPVTTLTGDHNPTPDTFLDVDRYLAVSDVEGHYEYLLEFLQNNGVIDSSNRWTFGKGHLILLGDMVDRGEKVTEVLWLIHKLEREALAAGGRVHYLLGNHEKMLLEGDHRYLNEKYTTVAEMFGRPYSEFFSVSKNTELGLWMRSKNSLLKIGDTLFVHAGLADSIRDLSEEISGVNEKIRTGLTFPDAPRSDAKMKWLLSSEGPLWYRGYFKDEALTAFEIGKTLSAFGARRVVVGHTIVPSVRELHDGLVIGIDTSFKTKTKIQGLLFERGAFRSVDIKGQTSSL